MKNKKKNKNNKNNRKASMVCEDYHYTECGLDSVFIQDMPVCVDDSGEAVIEIPMINMLHAVLVMELVLKDSGLSSQEVKFVRTELGLTQGELAERVKKDGQTIGRWERGEFSVDPTAEMIIRMLAFEHLQDIGFLDASKDKPAEFTIRNLSEKCVPSANDHPIHLQVDKTQGYRRVA